MLFVVVKKICYQAQQIILLYQQLKNKNPNFNTIDFRVMQCREFFNELFYKSLKIKDRFCFQILF